MMSDFLQERSMKLLATRTLLEMTRDDLGSSVPNQTAVAHLGSGPLAPRTQQSPHRAAVPNAASWCKCGCSTTWHSLQSEPTTQPGCCHPTIAELLPNEPVIGPLNGSQDLAISCECCEERAHAYSQVVHRSPPVCACEFIEFPIR
jgi:hypothetical protein